MSRRTVVLQVLALASYLGLPTWGCLDLNNIHCAAWKQAGECERNKGYMHRHCAHTCSVCAKEAEVAGRRITSMRTEGHPGSRRSANLPRDSSTGVASEESLARRHKEQRKTSQLRASFARTRGVDGLFDDRELSLSTDLEDLGGSHGLVSAHFNAELVSSRDFPHHESTNGPDLRVGLTSSYLAKEAARLQAPPPPPSATWEWAQVTDDDEYNDAVEDTNKQTALQFSLPAGVGSQFVETLEGQVCQAEDLQHTSCHL